MMTFRSSLPVSTHRFDGIAVSTRAFLAADFFIFNQSVKKKGSIHIFPPGVALTAQKTCTWLVINSWVKFGVKQVLHFLL
jgi:hypothetical protein